MRRAVIAAFVGISLWASPAAAEPNEPVSGAMDSLTRGLVQEQDIDLVFGYLREALGAAVQGREAPPPDELRRRADEIGD